MSTDLIAGEPLEPPRRRVGRISAVLFDASRDDRVVAVDAWYPAAPGDAGERSLYELLPGVGFTAAAERDAPVADGPHPLVLFSHGRSGTRSSYALLCEALAARGYVVVAPEHTGDSLVDWLLGTAVDDETNEANRAADARFVLDAVFDAAGPLGTVGAQVDADRIAAAGHSYGGNTAISLASGPGADARVRAIAGLQAFTRTIAKQVFEAMKLPALLITGSHDATTPPATDADRAWAKLGAEPAWRVDIERAGHQGCSDVGLYLELAPQVPDLPPIVGDYVASMAADVTGTPGEPWRETVALHVRVLGAFLDGALGIDAGNATAEIDAVSALAGVTVGQRGSFS
jgi:predicted dienelactone hydrolase